ncbi:MAG TPA: alginate lyase family protein [Pyrinomonadaceae bacterium]|nr:alginate lyase family protein [Pyrinomonadaceae bacterium]
MRDEEKKNRSSFIPHPSSLIPRLRRALRGDVGARTLALEVLRRSRARSARRRERAALEKLAQAPARLRAEFSRMSPPELLDHFRNRTNPKFLPGSGALSHATPDLQRSLFPSETAELIERAARVADEHCWRVMGYGEKCFGENVNWLIDPASGASWPLDYHADVQLVRGDGSDARVLWEVNRLAHLLTLARAYAVTGDEKFAREAFTQLRGWREQNPLGRGPNWACAMEVALRAMNLLAVFELLRRSPLMDEEALLLFLETFDRHGAHIRRNLEFSYISTSNHYLSDVVGLFWLGVMLPELEGARAWREMGLRETLREMDKQVLADGADCEASTGYHRLVLELFLYSFTLARANGVEVGERYWARLRKMLEYVRAYLRPDGRAPLVGDTDSGQVLPLVPRAADDHAYLLALGAALFNEPGFKQSAAAPEELLWTLGEEGVRAFQNLPETNAGTISQAFADAGTYVLRERDLYLLFNASGNGLGGRGSHGHNDALSLEVSACGTSFIVDPGTYVYSADLHERHLFRSTAYHSTVQVDDEEQNTTAPELPFVIGDEAHPRAHGLLVIDEHELIVAEHDGYRRLAQPVTHRRAVWFKKQERCWVVQDTLSGEGEHLFRFRFHLAEGLETDVRAQGIVSACDRMTGARLFVCALDLEHAPELEPRFVSRDYGAKSASLSVCWTVRAPAPCVFHWALVPVCANEDERARLSLIERLKNDEAETV